MKAQRVLADPGQSPYDLNFSLLGIPVRVHPFFWLVSALFVWDVSIRLGLGYVFAGVACTFVSILIHELGHVLMGKLFGADGYIVLYSFGGLAVGSNNLSRRWQRVAVSFAGPLAQFLVLGFIALAGFLGMIPDQLAVWQEFVLDLMIYINLFWPLMNLLPVWPLDGGMISREVFEGLKGNQGLRWSLGLSMACAGVIAANALLEMTSHKQLIPYLPVGMWPLLLFGSLAYSSYQMLQQLGPPGGGARYDHYGDRAEWERDPDYWK